MRANEKYPERLGLFGLLFVGLFSVFSAGILPLVFSSIASTRRKRLKTFFRDAKVRDRLAKAALKQDKHYARQKVIK